MGNEEELDLFDEFKIKPMTKGLGFHKEEPKRGKNSRQTSPVRPSSLSENQLKNPSPSVSKAGFHGFSSLDRQLMEMNALMKELDHSLKEKTIPIKENKDLLELEGEEPQMERKPKAPIKKTLTPSSLSFSSSSSSPSPLPSFSPPSQSRSFTSPQPSPQPSYQAQKTQKASSSFSPLRQKTSFSTQPLSPTPVVESDGTSSGTSSETSSETFEKKKPSFSSSPSEWVSTFTPHLGVLLIDGCVSLGLTLIFLMALVNITQVDLLVLTFQANRGDFLLYICFFLLYISNLFLYLILSRGFFGQSVGEWAFDCCLGSERQRKSIFYPFFVLWRVFFVFATGIVLLPLLSLFFQRDVAFYFTGLALKKKRRQ